MSTQGTGAKTVGAVLEGKVFAITGGASGIGLATAKILSGRGATVCIADIDTDALKAAEDYFNPLERGFSATHLDVTRRLDVDAWINRIVDEFGRLDGAANVAGTIGKCHGVTPVTQMDDAEWDRIIAVNLTGLMYCLRAELRKIVDGGSVVNVASVHGVKGKLPVGRPTRGRH